MSGIHEVRKDAMNSLADNSALPFDHRRKQLSVASNDLETAKAGAVADKLRLAVTFR